jgi:hypothetical protein
MKLTRQQIEEKRTPQGGFLKNDLISFGVPWPPPKGWLRRLLRGEFDAAGTLFNSKRKRRRNRFQTDTGNIFFNSDAWKALRYRVLRHWGARCMCCGATPSDGNLGSFGSEREALERARTLETQVTVAKSDLLSLTQYALEHAISDKTRKIAQRCENLCAVQSLLREKIIETGADVVARDLLAALLAVKDNAVFDEETHRALVDEWVITRVRAAITTALQGEAA